MTPILNLLEAYLPIGTANRQFAWDDTGKGIAHSPLSPMLSNSLSLEVVRRSG